VIAGPSRVGKELEQSNFGVLCLTRENLDAPWLVFEAGALSKVVATSAVCPYLLDVEVSEISGPLSQFQAKRSDKAGTLDLLRAINAKSEIALDESRLTQAFENLWPVLETALTEIPKSAAEPKRSRPQAEVLEDVVTSVRALEDAFRSFDLKLDAAIRPVSPSQSFLAPERKVQLVAEDDFPAMKKGTSYQMRVRVGDVIPMVASIAGVTPDSYGKTWHLRHDVGEEGMGRVLTKRECVTLFRGVGLLRLVLTKVPF